MTDEYIIQTALAQSAYDSSCEPGDFLKKEPVVVTSRPHPMARRYLTLPFLLDLTSYGTNIVASVAPQHDALAEYVRRYIDRPDVEHCFETPVLHGLNDYLTASGYRICFMAEYFLPSVGSLEAAGVRNVCPYPTKILHGADFEGLYIPEWSNALCEARKELDVLGVGAYDGEKLIGLAACSADCDTMRQIGIDVLPEYRRQGVAKALVTKLALEIVEAGKVPFYCAAWSNIKSVRCALASGFRPAWCQVTAKNLAYCVKLAGE